MEKKATGGGLFGLADKFPFAYDAIVIATGVVVGGIILSLVHHFVLPSIISMQSKMGGGASTASSASAPAPAAAAPASTTAAASV